MSYFSKVIQVAVFAACSVCVHAQDAEQTLTQNLTHTCDRTTDGVHVACLMEVKPDVKENFVVTPKTIVSGHDFSRSRYQSRACKGPDHLRRADEEE